MEVDSVDPLATLVKRPKPLHADRTVEEEELGEYVEESEETWRDETVEGGGEDLRKTLQKKRKRRNLKMRLGHNPRLVEEHA